jgi:pimeloyl-ACP methyl ester carboxylesterase
LAGHRGQPTANGSCWLAVAEQLGNAGFPSPTPTLPGHHAAGDRSHVTHDCYVRTVVAALDAAPGPVVLVGHSFGGSVISRVAEHRPERCRLLVYCSGFANTADQATVNAIYPAARA